ncbi:hypothetical protein VTL71DRAFT_9294 [Oculimacula yallundae]|uniref:Uncharacterized protein n=1 Tax=Oculimacula yallundae TaxID=86028 RepID=A0ABR4BVC2_9HELO
MLPRQRTYHTAVGCSTPYWVVLRVRWCLFGMFVVERLDVKVLQELRPTVFEKHWKVGYSKRMWLFENKYSAK